MAIINPPAWMQQGSYPARTDRLVLNSTVRNEGVVEGFAVSQTTTATMAVRVAAGKAFVDGTSVALQGIYNVINDASVTLTVATSDSTFARYDLVVLTVRDADVAGSVNQGVLQVITGTPSSNPQVPSLPASSLALGRLLIGANSTSVSTASISDVRLFTAAAGGIVWVPDTAARLRLTPATSSAYYVHQQDTGVLWRNSGSGWVLVGPDPQALTKPLAADSGRVSTPSTIAAGAASLTVPVVFTPGRFSTPPMVTATPTNGRLTVAYKDVTTSGFDITVNNWSTGTAAAGIDIMWIALQTQ